MFRKLLPIFGIAFLLFGCNTESNAATDSILHPKMPKLPTTELNTKDLDVENFDMNSDGKPDQLIYTNKDGEKVFVVRDFNFDDVPDLTEIYEKGVHVRDEIDLDYDGKCDLIVTYNNGIVTKKEYSVDFESNRHGIQYFDAEGNRIKIERDTNMDGKLDIREFFNPGEDEPYKTEQISQ